MCNLKLLPLVEKFKNQDMSVFEIIYNEFETLIDFYSRYMEREDIKSELTLFLLELLYKVDLSGFNHDSSINFKKYIAVCIRNKYIKLSRKIQNEGSRMTALYDNSAICCDTYEDKIAIEQILGFLTDKQKRVIVNRYLLGYSDQEIAKLLNVERQAVFQIKKRALKIMKDKYRR